MKHRKLGASALPVSPIALGHSMGMTDLSEQGRADFERLIHRAVELGVNFFDSSDAYWNGRHEEWLGAAIKPHRDRVVVTSKLGNITLPDGRKATNAKPEYILKCCDESLKRLGVDQIDLYYLHRVDPATPIEDSIGAMSRLVEQGKVRYIGVCEAGFPTIERAHRVHPITALQTEYSLWSREVESEILPACRRLNIGYVAYSPLGRGLLTGAIKRLADLAPTDRRRIHPRFHDANLPRNLALVAELDRIAKELRLSSAQLALAWVLSRGDDIVALTGTKQIGHLEQSVEACSADLPPEHRARLEALFPLGAGAGERYPPEMLPGLGI
jgi:aryl-alcohol dehydrogenase-like predicted oxidoreductase